MFELKTTTHPPKRACLVGIQWGAESPETAQDLLAELAELVGTLGLAITERVMLRARKPQPRYLVGSGQAERIIAGARASGADVIIFDDAISPAQQRNWEKLAELAVIDREEVILDIFARRARTHEARLQVELAKMQYSLPRLTRAWQHLERQAGTGAGMTGAGESQLETDRRLVRKRIDNLRREIAVARLQRATRRKQRLRLPTPHVAIVGYTNTGKSSLFLQLTGERVLIEDKLFATLDTTTRPIQLADGQRLLVTDTVGFVRKLPHGLVESFRTTLEESVLSDLLLHVLDASGNAIEEFHATTINVLEELGADLRRTVTVFNKVDLPAAQARLPALRRQFPEALFVSALTGEGIAGLRDALAREMSGEVAHGEFLIPQSRYDLVSEIRRTGHILSETYEGDRVLLTANLPRRLLPKVEEFRRHHSSPTTPSSS